MSSLRNAVNRRVHRERDQLESRARLGRLEKHKDYKLRAASFNKKKEQLKNLRAKAATRNEDEFYYGMLSRKGPQGVLSKGKRWTGTVDGDRGNKVLDLDTVRLLKTQDIGYLRTARNVAAKDVKQLEERVVGLGGSLDPDKEMDMDDDDEFGGFDDDDAPQKRAKPKKTVFADELDEREERIQRDADQELEDEEGEMDVDEENPEKLRAEQRQRLLEKLQRRLQHSRKKVWILTRAEHELDMQRAKMSKTPTSMNVVTKAGKQVKVRQRKR
ncbi:Uu.00g033920.m01.CDS01 [Anthostomella pinea]|uniref:U3 small nucleolar RNA-associated protein 11 n=1 Tax=Anthostomella pinea TaxID=933095 RepID=A0AAI8V8Z1_9PEZI|nr:Uu.00g033920.m01.CDS01 [Anthostomella pinea]